VLRFQSTLIVKCKYYILICYWTVAKWLNV
jgi:hypothetical protein